MTPRPWAWAIASVVGTGHARTAVPCQDSAHCGQLRVGDEDVLVAVASDGAGSAQRSAEGSAIACAVVVSQICDYFDGGGSLEALDDATARAWLSCTRKTLETHANREGQEVRDYACTLLVAIVGDRNAAFIQLGDGAIVVADAQPQTGWSWVFWPQKGEFANTTRFITDETLDGFEFSLSFQRIDEIAIFTDGLESLVLHFATRTVYSKFFDQMIPPIRQSTACGEDASLSRQLATYLSSAPVCARTDDDKTLLLASRCAPECLASPP